jgi:Fe2+ transport system protein B
MADVKFSDYLENDRRGRTAILKIFKEEKLEVLNIVKDAVSENPSQFFKSIEDEIEKIIIRKFWKYLSLFFVVIIPVFAGLIKIYEFFNN